MTKEPAALVSVMGREVARVEAERDRLQAELERLWHAAERTEIIPADDALDPYIRVRSDRERLAAIDALLYPSEPTG